MPSPSKIAVCFIPRGSSPCRVKTAWASGIDAFRSYRNSIDASGNAALNQRKITKSETAAIAAHTAMSVQSRRVSQYDRFHQVPYCLPGRHPLPGLGISLTSPKL